LSYVHANAAELGIDEDCFAQSDIHLHVPAGAQPKDGPSAGVTMATALVSLASGRSVQCEVGMTGEITLRGQVMPVGGIKEKVLAAHRSGLQTVILPSRNEADLEDLPDDVREAIKFIFVDIVDEVLEAALMPPPARKPKRKKKVAKPKVDTEDLENQEN
jgi:ATP-dependent Lon protease